MVSDMEKFRLLRRGLKSLPVCSLFVIAHSVALFAQQDSLHVRKIGHWPYAIAYDVAYDSRNDVAFLGNGHAMLSLDVSKPANPVRIGEVYLSGQHNRIALSGDYVYMALGQRGLDIIDISDPRSPVITSSLETPGFAFSIHVSGSYAYVADRSGGLRIVDVSDRLRPVEVGAYQTTGSAMYVVESGNRVYLSDWGAGLRILDVSSPSQPHQVGFFPAADIWGVALSGNYAIIQQFDGSDIRIIDVSDPSSPTEVSSIDWTAQGNGVNLVVKDTYAYVCAEWMDGVGVHIVDISDPLNPAPVGSIRNTPSASIAVSGDFAYVSDWANGFHIYDISTPASPILLSNYDVPGILNDVTVAEDVVYIANEGYVHPEPGSAHFLHVELRLIDVSTPSSPREIGFSQGGIATGKGVAASAGHAYIASDFNGLRVFDVSSPATPAETGFILTPGRSVRVILSGSHALVAAGESGLRIIDIRDPFAPVETGFCDSPGFTSDVAVSGDYAFLADGSHGIRIVDIATRSLPQEVGHLMTSEPLISVAVSGNDVFAGGSNGNLYRIDVSNPTAPVLKSMLSFPGSGIIRRVAVSGDYAYLAAGLDGVRIVDISRPVSMTQRAFYLPGADVNSLALWDNYIYAITFDAGLYVLEFLADFSSRRRAVRRP